MDTVTYPDEKVAAAITERFVPVKVNIIEKPEMAQCYRVNWTPTVVVTDPEGVEHYRFFGFMPASDFLAKIALAEGYANFNNGRHDRAAKLFEGVSSGFAETDSAPEAMYMCGVAKYKSGGGRDALIAEWRKLSDKYPKSEWARKASFVFG